MGERMMHDDGNYGEDESAGGVDHRESQNDTRRFTFLGVDGTEEGDYGNNIRRLF